MQYQKIFYILILAPDCFSDEYLLIQFSVDISNRINLWKTLCFDSSWIFCWFYWSYRRCWKVSEILLLIQLRYIPVDKTLVDKYKKRIDLLSNTLLYLRRNNSLIETLPLYYQEVCLIYKKRGLKYYRISEEKKHMILLLLSQ